MTDDRPVLVTPDILDALRQWLPDRRWFGDKGRRITRVELVLDEQLSGGDPTVHDVVVRVRYDGGDDALYHVPLATRDGDLPDRLEHAVVDHGGRPVVYDALVDPEASGVFLEHLAAGDRSGAVRFRHTDEPVETGLPGHAIAGEQSNTSVIYGDSYILKVFRRLAPGVNPDVEIGVALARVGSEHVPRPLGWLEADIDGETYTTGFLQQFLQNATDGWTMATTSVRDLYAEGDLHADEVGGDFAGESRRIGQLTASLHAELRQALGTETLGADAVRTLTDRFTGRLDEACGAVPELAQRRADIAALYARVPDEVAQLQVQRIHGDYHLGQLMRTAGGWTALDFEGEPARPLAERQQRDSALRDVAGMLRSFDYAARHLLADWEDLPHLRVRADEWSERNRGAFCDGYAEVAGRDPREDVVLLRAFEVDKAVYEVLYEARNRPGWVVIPMSSIERLVTT